MSRSTPDLQSGFTLIEVLVALAILGLSFAALFRVFSSGLISVERAGEWRAAAGYARSILDRVGADLPIQAGATDGELDGFRWHLTIDPYGPRSDPQAAVVRPCIVSVTILWGGPDRERVLSLKTLRLGPAS